MNKEEWECKMEETFFLAYHLGWNRQKIKQLDSQKRKELIQLYIDRRKNGR